VPPDGHVTTGKAFFAAPIDRRPLEIGSTGGAGVNDAATHSRDTAGNSEKYTKSRERSFCMGLWAAALQDPLSPLGPVKHANKLIFNALRTLRSNGGEAAGQGALSAAMRDIQIDGLVVSDRGWLPRRILAGPDMEKALAAADAAWVAFGQAFHRVTRGACAHTAWLAYEALLADGRPNPDPPDPTWPMPSAHQTMAAALLFDQIKALVVSHSDHLDVSLGLKAQAWRKSGAGKSQEPDHAARPEGGQ